MNRIVELDFTHEAPYVIAEAECPFCSKIALFSCIESTNSPLKTLEVCQHAHSIGWQAGIRVVEFKPF